MFAGLMFAVQIFFFALCAGVALALIIFVPCAIFTILYSLWVGGQNCAGRYKELKDEKVMKSVKNACKLYKAWITRKPPVF